MLNEFKNYLLNKNYKTSTAEDYQGRIERLCRKENFSLEHLAQNIKDILPLYEVAVITNIVLTIMTAYEY